MERPLASIKAPVAETYSACTKSLTVWFFLLYWLATNDAASHNKQMIFYSRIVVGGTKPIHQRHSIKNRTQYARLVSTCFVLQLAHTRHNGTRTYVHQQRHRYTSFMLCGQADWVRHMYMYVVRNDVTSVKCWIKVTSDWVQILLYVSLSLYLAVNWIFIML